MRRYLPWAILALVVFYIVKNPSEAAVTGKHIGNGIVAIANAFGTFFTRLVA